MSNNREKVVRTLFDKIDVQKYGIIEIEKIVKLFDEEKHPLVISKKISPQRAFYDFLVSLEIYLELIVI